jgi:hypothetical protein
MVERKQFLDEGPITGAFGRGGHAAPQLPACRADGHLLAAAVLRVNSQLRVPARWESLTGPLLPL